MRFHKLILLAFGVLFTLSVARGAPQKVLLHDESGRLWLNLHFESTEDGVGMQILSNVHDERTILESKLHLADNFGEASRCNDGDVCFRWNNRLKLSVQRQSSECAEFRLTSNDTEIRQCNSLRHAQWYGGPSVWNQLWPVQALTLSESPYVTGQGEFLGVVESYWLSSLASALYVPEDIPLFISQDSTTLCFISKIADPYPPRDKTSELELRYSVCQGDDAREVHLEAVNTLLGRPTDIPDERMIRHPIWSTWARYKSDINESVVREFANEIVSYGFGNSQLEIDDRWESCYGDAVFDRDRFLNPGDMMQDLHKMGFRVTLWVHPFINEGCSSYTYAVDTGFSVRNRTGAPGVVSWWNGQGVIVDFTNSDAVEWWTSRLDSLKTYHGVDSFKFDAGETGTLPESPSLHGNPELEPNIFSTSYVETVSSFGKFIEVRVGRRTQALPTFVRMMDKGSSWGYDNGLKSLITTLLQMNMVGYPFVLPDMIGGNGYGEGPTKELFIRWLQATTFMPSLQFSYVPWDYDNETVEIAHKFTDLHLEFSNKIIEAARRATVDGTPVNPPIWWVDPADEDAQKVDSEYLLGEDILVAPILDEGATSRDIYLPAGKWRDEIRLGNPIIGGPVLLKAYEVALDELPYFTKML